LIHEDRQKDKHITRENVNIFIVEDSTVLGKTLSATYNNLRNHDSSVGTPMGYEMDGRGSIPGRSKRLLHSVKTGSEAHPASYRMGTEDSFPGSKAAGA
jgi:hypothetical protein